MLNEYFKEYGLTIFKVVSALDASDEITLHRGGKAVPFYSAFFKELRKGFGQVRREMVWNRGFEVSFFDFISLRIGSLVDETGDRLENHIGWGLNIPNPYIDLRYDYYKIDFAGGIRTDQEGYSVQFGIRF